MRVHPSLITLRRLPSSQDQQLRGRGQPLAVPAALLLHPGAEPLHPGHGLLPVLLLPAPDRIGPGTAFNNSLSFIPNQESH